MATRPALLLTTTALLVAAGTAAALVPLVLVVHVSPAFPGGRLQTPREGGTRLRAELPCG